MRTFLLLTALSFSCSMVCAQGARSAPGRVSERIQAHHQAGATFQRVALFAHEHPDAERDARWQEDLADATLLATTTASLAAMDTERPALMRLELPSSTGLLELDLEKVDLFTDDFSVVVAGTGGVMPYDQGVHYRGTVHGEPNSLVAISVFKNEVMGFVSKNDGDLTLGKLEGDPSGTHILYRTSDLIDPPVIVCGTADDGHGYAAADLVPVGDNRTVKCVRLYWEVNHDIFLGKGSVVNATNYVTGLFNQTAVLYNNDGISVTLSQVYVWDVPSPYTATSTSSLLDQFGAYRTSFNGDLGHLLGYAGGGGIAWLNTLCSSTSYRMAYSDIGSSYSNVPTYSWSVEVVTHEQGHNMGSRHTHACAWNGNNTAIDGCGPAAGYTEGSCTTAPLPTGGGTIMSYCHLVGGTGINFNNGFGPQPATLIVNNINNANCLAACATGTCATPSGLATSNVTTTSATLSWAPVSGSLSCSLQWKPASGSTWTTVTGLTSTSYALTGLSAGTSYQFQVLAVCSGGSSAYSTAATFTTASTGGCPDIQEPNGTSAAAGTITSGTGIAAIIANTTDEDYYKLVLSATSNITVSLTNLPFDYDTRLLNGSGTQLASSTNGSTTAESMTYSNAAAGTYYVHVYGYNGAFSTGTCYALVATATVVASCTDNYEPNETNGGARTISANGSITARLSTSTDVDWFKFANTSAQRYIKVNLTNLPANYNMQLYRGSGLLGTSQNSGTTSEQIIYNSNTISSNYKVRVYGSSGAYNATSCYTLTTQISSTAFMPGDEPGGTIDEGAWNAATGAAIFPNPANEVINVLLPAGSGAARIDVVDAMGRIVQTFTSEVTDMEQRIRFDVRGQGPGLYFVRVECDGMVDVQRVVIQR